MKPKIGGAEHLRRALEHQGRVHKYNFYVSLAMTMIFFWNFGGRSIFWNLVFVAVGIGIDLTRDAELGVASWTNEKRERVRKKSLAMLLTIISLVASLASSLLRAEAVVSESVMASSTEAIDREIARLEAEYAARTKRIEAFPLDWFTRRAAEEQANSATADRLSTLYSEREAARVSGGGTESLGDMLTLLARFFGVTSPEGYKSFLVILMMMAAFGTELSFWFTTPKNYLLPPETEPEDAPLNRLNWAASKPEAPKPSTRTESAADALLRVPEPVAPIRFPYEKETTMSETPIPDAVIDRHFEEMKKRVLPVRPAEATTPSAVKAPPIKLNPKLDEESLF